MSNGTRVPHRRRSAGSGLVALVVLVAGCIDTQASPREAPVRVAAAPYIPDSGTLAIRCGRLIDGLSPESRTDITVVIAAGRIASVGKAEPGTVPVDLTQYTCLPGLIDMHTHLTDRPGDTADLSVYYRRSREDHAPIALENARVTLMAGLT